jgi:tryptophan 2,3-dioxygenase
MSWVKNLSILRKASKTDVSLVERIIGDHPGTGGTSGVNYLRSTLDSSFFPELYSMRVQL